MQQNSNTDWVYYMDVNPYNIENMRINKYKDEFTESLEIFLEECKLNPQEIENLIKNKQKWIIQIQEDTINKNSTYNIKFLRSKFMTHSKFIKQLREYYNSLGYFIKGPQKISNLTWEFELSHRLNYLYNNQYHHQHHRNYHHYRNQN